MKQLSLKTLMRLWYTVLILLPMAVSASTTPPVEKIKPIASLPLLPVESISDYVLPYNLEGDDIVPSMIKREVHGLDVLPNHRTSYQRKQYELDKEGNLIFHNAMTAAELGNEFFLEGLESEVSAFINKEQLSAPVPPPPPGNFGSFMNTIAKGQYASKAKKAKKIIEKALDIGNFIDKLTGGNLVSMPIVMQQTIGQKQIDIVFNEAKIYSQYAEIEVYIRIDMAQQDFNGQPVVLYFGSDNIKFSAEDGIISGVVGLLADYAVKLGDSEDAGVYIKKHVLSDDGGNLDPSDDINLGTYVSFDCDGFKELGFAGNVILSRSWVIPTDEWGVHATSAPGPNDVGDSPRVQASFQIVAQDLDDIMISIDINSPFVVTKWQEMVFQLNNANLDMSTFRNPEGIPYDIPANVWEGVYIEHVGITLPAPFKRSCSSFADTQQTGGTQNPSYEAPQTCRMKVSADHLLIDPNGVSGTFNLEGQAPLIGGAVMDGEWGWSLDQVGIVVEQSDVIGFNFSGEIGVPIISKEGALTYSAEAIFGGGSHYYDFEIGMPKDGKPVSFPVFNAATVELVAPTVNITVDNGEFSAGVSFQQASLLIGNRDDYESSRTGSAVKMPGVTFHGLSLNTRSPRVTMTSIEVTTPDSKLSNFPVTVNGWRFAENSATNEMSIGFDLMIKLMNSSNSTVNATGGFDIVGEYVRDIDGTRNWKYKNLLFSTAEINIDIPQFKASGYLAIMRDDEVYGNGFSAELNASIMDGKFDLEMMAIFGTTSEYRYWMVDGFVGGTAINVPLVPPFTLNGFGGGAFHHMKPDSFVEENSEGESAYAPGVSLSGIKYVPHSGTTFGIKFAVGLSTVGNLMDGRLTCILRFNGMSLQNITFWGTADIMLPSEVGEKLAKGANSLAERLGTLADAADKIQADDKVKAQAVADGIKAKIGISLNFEGPFVFHAYGEVSIKVGNILTGSGAIDVLLGDGAWHVYVGGYYGGIPIPGFFDDTPMTLSPVSATIQYSGFSVNANMYFMTGNDIPGPPPPHPKVVQFFGDAAEQSNRELMDDCANPAMGTGIAFGASAFFKFSKVKKGLFGSCVGGLKVNVHGGIGFDLALIKYGSSASCTGGGSGDGINGFRATGRVFVFIEIKKGHFTCIPIPPLGIGLAIKFDVPDPSYFQILAVIKVGKTFRFNLELGDECGSMCSDGVTLDDI